MANNIFHGVPWDHSASVGFDNDPTITYFFRMNPTTNLNEVSFKTSPFFNIASVLVIMILGVFYATWW